MQKLLSIVCVTLFCSACTSPKQTTNNAPLDTAGSECLSGKSS